MEQQQVQIPLSELYHEDETAWLEAMSSLVAERRHGELDHQHLGEFLSDMSIFKNFVITERVKAQFQAEFFNVFNHPVYNGPNNCIDCQGGGIINSLEPDTLMRQFQLGVRVTF